MIVTRKSLIPERPPSPEDWDAAHVASKRALEGMTPEEDARITADAMSDPDSIPMTDEEFANARRVPLWEALPPGTVSILTLDADVADLLEEEGANWEARANAILRQALERA